MIGLTNQTILIAGGANYPEYNARDCIHLYGRKAQVNLAIENIKREIVMMEWYMRKYHEM